jgi:phage terminase large subunit-like protein
LTISPPADVLAGLRGVQTPRLHSLPADVATRYAGQDAVDLAASAGLHLDPWQQLVLRDGLAERADGLWAAFEVGLVVPRQCGKGSVLEALELASLFLPDPDGPPPLILHSAHEFKTSAEHFRRMRDLIDGSDHLRKRVRIVRTAAGSESIELHSGARLRFVTRTGGSGRGFSADLIVVDEAYNLTPEAMAAMLPTMSARPNPQVWYTSSAGMPASTQLARLRSRGIEGGGRLAYFEWSAPDGADLDDPNVWAQANPALGVRIPVDFVAAEREAMPDEQFARERLGIWAAIVGGKVIDLDLWGSRSTGVQPMSTPTLAVEVALDRSSATLGAAWTVRGRSHVEVVEDRPGTGWVVPRCAELVARYGGGTVVLDAGTEAAGLAKPLEDAGLTVVLVNGPARVAACGGFYDAVVAGGLSHSGDPAIAAAIANARWKDVGDGGRVFSRRRSAGDIAALYAPVLALHGLTNSPTTESDSYVL